MKTRNLIVTVIIVLSLGSASVYASETRTIAQEKLKSDLCQQLQKVFFDDVLERDCCQLTLVFRVNNQSILTDFEVSGENKAMVQRVEEVLASESLVADQVLKNGKYQVKLSFQNRFAM